MNLASQRINSAALAPAVSVLMPVFNTGKYLAEALQSISNQSYTDFELVVIDDGSTDGSTELLKQYALKEPRLRLISRENRGLIATRNQLLAEAKGSLIAWMDSDDISYPQRLATQVTVLSGDPSLVCVGTYAQCIDPNGELLNVEQYPQTHPEILAEQLRGGAMRFPTTMMRLDAARSVGGFREPFRIGEDFDLLLRLSEVGTMHNLTESLYYYRQHLASVCGTLGDQWRAYRDVVLELAEERRMTGHDRLQQGGMVQIPKLKTQSNRSFVSRIYMDWARSTLGHGNVKTAVRYVFAALANEPFSVTVWRSALRLAIRGSQLKAN